MMISTYPSSIRQSLISVVSAGLLLMMGSACTQKAGEPSGSTAAQQASVDTILIGEVGSMTGNEASFGVSTHNGIELALKQINSQGGVKGKQLKDLLVDDQGKPDEAATAVTKLITQNKVTAILGEVASGRSKAMAPIAQRYQTPMI